MSKLVQNKLWYRLKNSGDTITIPPVQHHEHGNKRFGVEQTVNWQTTIKQQILEHLMVRVFY